MISARLLWRFDSPAGVRYNVAVHQRFLRLGPGAVLTAAVGLSLFGCTKPHTATTVVPDLSRPIPTLPDMSRPAIPVTAGEKMPFALVAIGEVTRLHRLLDGGVLAASGGALYALDHEGSVRSLDGVFFAMKSALGDLGNVGGTWPGTLLVETFRLGRGDGLTTSFILRGDDHKVTVDRRWTGSYFLPPAVWKDGALLTVRAEGHATEYGSPLDRTARLELIGPARSAAPRFPKDALFDDAFVAYPNGFVFALGGRRTRPVVEDDASEYEQEHHYMIDGAMIWQSDGTAATMQAIQLPDTSPRDRLRSGRLVMGKSEHETLAFGTLETWRQRQSQDQPYLARFGSSGWRRIPIEIPVLRIERGSDGSTWALIGSDGFANTDESFLARVILTADGGVKFARTPLSPNPQWLTLSEDAATFLKGCSKLRPRQLAVVNEKDRWLTAQCLTGHDYSSTVLLHTQEQKPLVSFKTFAREP